MGKFIEKIKTFTQRVKNELSEPDVISEEININTSGMSQKEQEILKSAENDAEKSYINPKTALKKKEKENNIGVIKQEKIISDENNKLNVKSKEIDNSRER